MTFFECILNGKSFEECKKIIADLPEIIDTDEIWKLEKKRYEKKKEIKSWGKRKKRKENIMNVLKRKLEYLQGGLVILKKKDLKNPWRGVYIFFILKLIKGYRYVVSKGGNIIITNREDVVDLYNSFWNIYCNKVPWSYYKKNIREISRVEKERILGKWFMVSKLLCRHSWTCFYGNH